MKRPEKKKYLDLKDLKATQTLNDYVRHKERVNGYNQACDEWEKYHQEAVLHINQTAIKTLELKDDETKELQDKIGSLPSEEEILEVIVQTMNNKIIEGYTPKDLAKVISKRLRNIK